MEKRNQYRERMNKNSTSFRGDKMKPTVVAEEAYVPRIIVCLIINFKNIICHLNYQTVLFANLYL